MTELERLLTLQLQQAQEQTEAQARQHKEDTEALLQQLDSLQNAWENSARSYSTSYSQQRSAFEEHKRQTESALSSMRQEIDKHRVETAHTLYKLETSLGDLTKQLDSLLSALDN